MAASQLTASSFSLRNLASFEGLRPTTTTTAPNMVKISSVGVFKQVGKMSQRFCSLSVNAATTVAPKYTTLKPLGDRVLVKINTAEEKSTGGILLPTSAQSKPQGGEVVAIGEGRTFGKNQVAVSVKEGSQVVYSKYAGTEVEFNGVNHLLLKEDDIVGILETDDVKDLKPLNDRVLIKVDVADNTTAGGLLLTQATKEKPSIGSVLAVGPGSFDEEGNRKPLTVSTGNTVLYSKYAGNDFKGVDGTEYITLRASDVMAVLA